LAQGERAVEKLNEALRLAPRGDPVRHWPSEIQRRLADIHTQRLDWRKAAPALEAIFNNEPGDVEAGQRLVDLYYKMGNEERAKRVLEQMLAYANERSDYVTGLIILRGQAEIHPDDLNLIRQVGEQYVLMGDMAAAISTWDPLIERMVRSGQSAQAMALLRKMISLKPANEARYRQILKALMAKAPTAQ
jgi:tetratricopeptide (TPR) repeat protein